MKKTSTHPHPVLPSYQSRDATCCVCHPLTETPPRNNGYAPIAKSHRRNAQRSASHGPSCRAEYHPISWRGIAIRSASSSAVCACCAQPKGNPIQIVKKRIAKISCLIPYKFQMVISSIPLCPKASGSDETSAEKSPFCRRIRLPPLGRLDQERQLGEGGESQQQPHGRQDTPVNHAHRRADETTHDEQDRESERQSKRPHGRQTTSGLDGSSGSGSSTLPSSVEVTRFTTLPLRS